jgi:hypothetical protein
VLVKRYEMDVNGNSQIELLGFVTVSRWATVAQMMPVLRRMGRYADDETLYVFEEETWNKRVPSIVSEKRDRSSSTLVELKLAFGDILIIQAAPKDMPPEESEEDETLEMQVRRSYPYTAQQYFQMMRRRVDLILQPFAYADGVKADPLPPLLLSADKQWSMGVSFERVVRIYNNATARWLADSERSAAEAKAKHTASDGTDPHLNAQLREATAALAEAQIRAATPLLADHIRLYEHPAHASSPPTALSLKDGEKLQNTLALAYTSKARKLYYERLPMSRAQLLECYDLRTQHGSLSGAMRSSVRIFVPKNGKVGDVIAAVRAKLAESSSHAGLAAAAGVQHAPPSPRPPHADDEEQAPGDALRLSTTITDAADIEDDTVETDALLCLKLSHDRLATVMQPEWPLDHMEMPTLAYGTTSELVMVPISKYESRLQASASAPLFIVQALDAQIDTFSIKVRGHPLMLHCADPNTTFGDIRARIAGASQRVARRRARVEVWHRACAARGSTLSALRYLHEANALGPALGDTGSRRHADRRRRRRPGAGRPLRGVPGDEDQRVARGQQAACVCATGVVGALMCTRSGADIRCRKSRSRSTVERDKSRIEQNKNGTHKTKRQVHVVAWHRSSELGDDARQTSPCTLS